MLESIEKLRLIIEAPIFDAGRDSLDNSIDAIEREISEMQENRLSERVYWQNEIHTILDTLTGRERFWGCNLEYPLDEGALSPSEIATREIAERYQLLPVDADGVPIHVGDYLQLGGSRGHVIALTYCPSNELPWEWQCDSDSDWYNTAFTHHAKPRTVEDVLEDFARDLTSDRTDSYEHRIERLGTKYADELREMLGSDELRKEGVDA